MSSETVDGLSELDREALEQRVAELEATVEWLKDAVEELQQDSGGNSAAAETPAESLTSLELLSQRVPEQSRADALGATDQRALAIFENWWNLARETPKGWAVDTKRNSTKKDNPSQFRIDLNGLTGEDLEWVQVYRAMKRVAELTGGEVNQNDYGRTHIHGGAFEYHEKTTPDGNHTYKLLRLSDKNSLTLL